MGSSGVGGLRRFLVNVLLQPSLCCCRADGSGPHAFISCSSLPPPMSSSSLWISLLVLLCLSCASCHVRVSHVAYTAYYGACTLIVHASLGQLFLSLNANGRGTSQGNWRNAGSAPTCPTCTWSAMGHGSWAAPPSRPSRQPLRPCATRPSRKGKRRGIPPGRNC